ncbi:MULTISPECIES: hypothetical protein [Mesorhizobium]|nr:MULTISPECIES: hypothetical protein [Mesorhizobium]
MIDKPAYIVSIFDKPRYPDYRGSRCFRMAREGSVEEITPKPKKR